MAEEAAVHATVFATATTPGTMPHTAGADTDMAIDYEIVTGVYQMLSNAATEISPQIDNMRTRVTGLLTQDGGLWMDSTSPAIVSVYQNFDQSAINMVKSIASFGSTFSQLVSDLQTMDQSNAKQILNPPASS